MDLNKVKQDLTKAREAISKALEEFDVTSKKEEAERIPQTRKILKRTRFSENQVSQIKYLGWLGYPAIEISNMFSCGTTTIYKILRGETYQNVKVATKLDSDLRDHVMKYL